MTPLGMRSLVEHRQRAALARRDHVRGDDEGPSPPRVPAPRDRRARLQRRRHHHITARIGFQDHPDVPAILRRGRRSRPRMPASTPRMRPTTCRGSRSCAAGRLACARGASGSSSLGRAMPPARSSTSACRVTARPYSAGHPLLGTARGRSLAPWKAQTVWVVGCRARVAAAPSRRRAATRRRRGRCPSRSARAPGDGVCRAAGHAAGHRALRDAGAARRVLPTGLSRILVLGPDSAVAPLVAAAIIPLAAAGDVSEWIAIAGVL